MTNLAKQWAGRSFVVSNLEQESIKITVSGRTLWGLESLIQAGAIGCTPIDTPGPRWSAYVFNLRELGVEITSVTEPHGGPFAGHHARYVLRSRVRAA